MASIVFRKQLSDTRQQRFSVTVHRDGTGLRRKPQMSSSDLMQIRPLAPNTFPTGTDTNAPRSK